MSQMSPKEALSQINQQLREDGVPYTFNDLRDRWQEGLNEAKAYGDDSVTIKIPSGSEFTADVKLVSAAMATRPDRNGWGM